MTGRSAGAVKPGNIIKLSEHHHLLVAEIKQPNDKQKALGCLGVAVDTEGKGITLDPRLNY